MRSLILSIAALAILATPADACHLRKRCRCKTACQSAPAQVQVYAAPQRPIQVQPTPQAPAKVAPAPQANAADPHGVVAWANAVRAQYGLHALVADPTLSAWAQSNSAQQASARYSGHFVNPGYFQISYYGPATAEAAVRGWLVPSHAGVLLSRTARVAGGAGHGPSWTLNVY